MPWHVRLWAAAAGAVALCPIIVDVINDRLVYTKTARTAASPAFYVTSTCTLSLSDLLPHECALVLPLVIPIAAHGCGALFLKVVVACSCGLSSAASTMRSMAAWSSLVLWGVWRQHLSSGSIKRPKFTVIRRVLSGILHFFVPVLTGNARRNKTVDEAAVRDEGGQQLCVLLRYKGSLGTPIESMQQGDLSVR